MEMTIYREKVTNCKMKEQGVKREVEVEVVVVVHRRLERSRK
jgi:hypothetical protein